VASELTEIPPSEPSVAPPATDAADPAHSSPNPPRGENVRVEDPRPDELDEPTVGLGRAAWFVTALACFVAAVIVFLEGYYGYGGVTLAVALAAAINLF
jgi:hypothetical protein